MIGVHRSVRTFDHAAIYSANGVMMIDSENTTVRTTAVTKRLYTHSASASYRSCNYQYYVSYVLGIRPLKHAHALFFGIMIHKGLEAYWNARKEGLPDPLGAALAALWFNIDPFDLAKARVMLTAYAAVWGKVKCEVLAVEAKFVMPLVHPDTRDSSDRFDRAGKIDAVIRLEDGKVAIVEHKTSAMDVGPGSDYQRRLTLDEQVSFYYGGATHLGFKPNLVIYDVLKKFDEKPKMATPKDKRIMVKDKKTKEMRLKAGQRETDETPSEYEKRLAATVAENPEDHIVRIPIYRLPAERKRFALDVWNQSKLMVMSIDNNMFPHNSAACFRYGSPCDFAQHCLAGARLDDPSLYKKIPELHPELADEPKVVT